VIAWGLLCVLIAAVLTTSTIELVKQSVSAVQDAAPQGISGGVAPTDPAGIESESKIVARIAASLGKTTDEVRNAYRDAQRDRKNSPEEALSKLSWLCLLIVCVYALKYFFTRGQNLFLTQAANDLAADLRRRMFQKVQKLPISYFNETRSGEIQSVLNNDVSVYQNAVQIIRDSIEGPVKAGAAFTYILVTQPYLSLMAVGTFPFMWLFIQSNGRRMRKAQAAVQQHLAELNAVTTEAILGTRVIKAFGAEAVVAMSYDSSITKALDSQMRAARRYATLRPMVELIGAVALALVLFICGQFAFQGRLQIAELAALMLAFDVINQGFRALGNVNSTYNQVQAAADRIYSRLLELPEEHAESQGVIRPENPKGRIAFENVGFIYADGTEALRNVTFVLEPGTSLALVGPSGAGKSTIADLLLRFYDPTSGRITFDGIDIRELDQCWLRSQIGVVPQQNFLFAGSIAQNLRLGNQNATEDQIMEAARISHADHFIALLPNGTESEIGEQGTGLSGGEQQRLSIARALVREPMILLMDEATSALDAHSEQAVQAALDEAIHSRTTLFIAHRLTTAARADQILVLRRGEVIEQGSHRELMESDGAYAQMFKAFGKGMLENDLG
jgi:subfamily B ATP-binding cassette protein MsbA